ncbi:MAG: DUF4382 domain-containing protein [Imperialibacter sp.]|uniref:DUF4382 domain-containing protein n=1 Tax=Imperialibacter sp. TaxID=2038411 RepID=UPI003A8972B5
MKIINPLIMLAFGLLCLSSCELGKDDREATLTVTLVDYPSDYEALYIEIKDVQINYTLDREEGWLSLDRMNGGVYNVLEYTAGKDTVLASGRVEPGTIRQIRVVYGYNNTLIIDGVVQDLTTFGNINFERDLIHNVNIVLKEGFDYDLTVDFDVPQSVSTYEEFAETFYLVPVARLFMKATTGIVKGRVVPGARRFVSLVKGNARISTYSNEQGEFVIGGVQEGIYDIVVSSLCEDCEVEDDIFLHVTEDGIVESRLKNIEARAEKIIDVGEVFFYIPDQGN